MIEIVVSVFDLIAVVVSADRDHGWRVGRRHGRMPFRKAAVSGCGNDDDALPNGLFSRKVNDAFRARNVLVSAERDAEDAYVVSFTILYHPTDPARDCFLGNPAALADFNQNEARVF